MGKNNNVKNLCALLRAGLWTEFGKQVSIDGAVDWEEIYQLASEQSVLGIVLAGIDCLPNEQRPPKVELLQWIGEIQMLEQLNKEMNSFIRELVDKMHNAGIYTLLVKGQGVAQCYEKPLWRSCGDVDLLLSADNYEKAKAFLNPLAEHVDPEDTTMKHLGMTIDQWVVELHGTMHTELSRRVNTGIDEVQDDCFYRGNVRTWDNNGTTVYLPSPDNDVILVFTHFLEHFFVEGVGLRQICDWCRLLYSYRDSLNYELLESRIRKMGLMSEWKAFYNLASRYLGMPDLDSELTIHDSRFDKKADRIMELVLESGNFGHNKDLSYRVKYKGITYKIVSLLRRFCDFFVFTTIFPIDAPRFFVTYVTGKVK